MDLEQWLRTSSLILTAVTGIYGTLFDFKHKGRVTYHGKIAIGAIVLSATAALWIASFHDMELSRQKAHLDDEVHRQQTILSNTAAVQRELAQTRGDLSKIQSTLKGAEKGLQSQLRQLRMVSAELSDSVQTSADSVSQQLVATRNELEKVEAASVSEIHRAAHPLHNISFSYCVVYDQADRRYPQYYRRLFTVWQDRRRFDWNEGVYRQEGVGEMRMHIQDDSAAKPSKNEDAFHLTYESALVSITRREQPETARSQLLYVLNTSSEHGDYMLSILPPMMPAEGVDLEVDFVKRTLSKCIRHGGAYLIANDGTFTSQMDLTGGDRSQGAYIRIMRQRDDHTALPLPEIVDLDLHFDDRVSYRVDLGAGNCRWLTTKAHGSEFICPLGQGQSFSSAGIFDSAFTGAERPPFTFRMTESAGDPPMENFLPFGRKRCNEWEQW